jgi:hypothetical protein
VVQTEGQSLGVFPTTIAGKHVKKFPHKSLVENSKFMF